MNFFFILPLLLIQASTNPKPINSAYNQEGQVSQEYQFQIKKLFHLTGLDKSFKTAIAETIKIYKKQKKNVPNSFWISLEKELSEKSLDQLAELFSPIYFKWLSMEDIKQIVVFYESPVGKKYALNTPKILEETMLLGQSWAMDNQTYILNQLIDKGYEKRMKQDY